MSLYSIDIFKIPRKPGKNLARIVMQLCSRAVMQSGLILVTNQYYL